RPYLWLGHHGLCCGAVGATVDHYRHVARGYRARTFSVDGCSLPVLPLADSPDGQKKEAEVTRGVPSSAPTRGDVRHGFVYERVPHITLKSIANNAEIDTI